MQEFFVPPVESKKTEAVSEAFQIKELDQAAIKDFIKTHQEEKYWVGMNEINWTADHPLLTLGASACLVLAFTNQKTNQIGLGHIPYCYIDHEKGNLSKTKEQLRLEGARDRLTDDGPDWELFLFGGQPADGSDKYRNVAEANREEVAKIFSSIGVECHDYTSKDPISGTVGGLIVDPNTKEIGVYYKETAVTDQSTNQE